MPEELRVNRVQVALANETVVMPWDSREELLARVREAPNSAPIIAAFENVGTSRPVKFSAEEKVALLEVVDHWLQEAKAPNLPAGILELRHELANDTDD